MDRPDPDLPISVGPCSNGEEVPEPVTPAVREAMRRTRVAATDHARRLGLDRREFLRTLSGAALMLMVLDACHRESRGGDAGGGFRLPPESTTEPEVARDAIGGEELVFDVQTHFLEYDLGEPGGNFGAGFPQAACGEDDPRACFSIEHYLEEVFLRSDTSMAVLSAIPVVGEDGPLSIRNMETARRVASALCADDRILLHGHAVPNLGRPEAALDAMDAAVEQHPVAAWKVYTHGPGPGWWLDDHEAGAPRVGRAFLDRARQLGVTTVCVHKGFSGGSRFASPEDVGPAAAAHPDLAFVVYHSGYEVSVPEGPFGEAGGGVDRLVASLRRAGVGPGSNVYAELGSTWWNVLRDPTRAAHVLGKLLVAVGEDNVLWGTDSIWYGSPQDQIQAFRAFEIGEELQELHGYPALTPARKAKILGANAARLYGVEPPTTACEFTREELEEVRRALPAPGRTWGPTTASQVRAWRSSHGWL